MLPANDYLDDNLKAPIDKKAFEGEVKLYGIAKVGGQFVAVSAVYNKGKVSGWHQHFLPEAEMEFAHDCLFRALAQDGIRSR